MRVNNLLWGAACVILLIPIQCAGVQTARTESAPMSQEKRRLVPTLGPADAVNAASFSRDGKLLATGSADGVAILWDVATGNEVRRFVATSNQVVQVQFFARDQKLLTGSSDGRARVWEVATGRPLLDVKGHVGELSHGYRYGAPYAVSPDGSLIFTADKEGVGHLWDSVGGALKAKLPKGKNSIGYAVFSPDGTRLLVAAQDGTKLYNLAKMTELWSMPEATGAVAFSRAGDRVVTSGSSITSIRDAKSGQELQQLKGPAFAVAFSPDGQLVLTSDFMEVTALWNAETGQQVWERPAREKNQAVAFTQDGKHFVTTSVDSRRGSWDSKVRMWETATRKQVQLFEGQANRLLAVGFRDGAPYILGADKYRSAMLWSGVPERGVTRLNGHIAPVHLGVLSADGKSVFLASLDNSASLWDVASGEEKFHLLPSTCYGGQCFWDLTFSNDGRSVYMAGTATKQWDTATGSFRGSFATEISTEADGSSRVGTRYFGGAGKVITSSDDKLVFTVPFGETVPRVYDALTRLEIEYLKDPNKKLSFSISSDGRLILVPCNSKGAAEFGIDLRTKVACVPARYSVFVLSHDGSRIVTGDPEGNVRVWDASTNKELKKVRQDATADFIAISEDNRFLLTASTQDNTARLWSVEAEKELCRITTFQNGTWVVTDSDGRFDTNDIEGARGLSWILDSEPLHPLPVEIFMRDYYTPQLLPKIMEGDKLAQIPSLAELNRVQPLIKIIRVEPEGGEGTVSVTVEVAAEESENVGNQKGVMRRTGIYDLRLFRDGQIVAQAPASGGAVELDPVSRKATLTFRHIPLPRDGVTTRVDFSAYAFNESRVKSATTHFRFEFSARAPQKGRAYIITFGVNSFANSAWNLNFAANDARKTREALVPKLEKTGRFAEVIPLSLVSDAQLEPREALATKKNLRLILESLAGQKPTEEAIKAIPGLEKVRKATLQDLVIISISTHGYTNGRGVFYFLPQDIVAAGGARSLDSESVKEFVSSDQLANWLRDVDAGELALIIDACHSAAFAGGEFKPGPMGSRGLGQLAYDKRMKILAATQADSVALEHNSLQHGILTYALLRDGLERSGADWQPSDQTITLTEWLAFGTKQVPKLLTDILERRLQVVDTTAPEAEQKPKDVIPDSDVARAVKNKKLLQQPSLFNFPTRRREVIISGFPFFHDGAVDVGTADSKSLDDAQEAELLAATQHPDPKASVAGLRRFIARHPHSSWIPPARITLIDKLIKAQATSLDLISASRMGMAYMSRETEHLMGFLIGRIDNVAGELLRRNEHLDVASEFIRFSLKVASERKDPEMTSRLLLRAARIELKRGKTDAVLTILAGLAENALDAQATLIEVARLYEEIGNQDAAIETYIKAAGAFGADSEMVEKPLAGLYQKRLGSLVGLKEKIDAARKASTDRVVFAAHIYDKAAPKWSLADSTGNEVGSQSYTGKPAVVAFWATWDETSSEALTSLQKLLPKFSGLDVVFLAVAAEKEGDPDLQLRRVRKFASDERLKVPYAVDTKHRVLSDFEVKGVPTFFVIDASGRIRFRLDGMPDHLEQILELQLQSLLAP